MEKRLEALVKWLLGPRPITRKQSSYLWARWIFLRALGLIYFSAFYSLLFQIKGLIGPTGILPATDYLRAVSGALHVHRFWFAPTLLWLGASDRALVLLCWAGIIASLLLVLNAWPRGTLAICFVCFLSFVSAAQDFSGYQSDGMLLEAGFLALFFAPPGFWPGFGRAHAPSRASRFLLLWEWFRIYFESGVGKIASGDTAWHQLTAMDDYYQNGPLPTWIGWYVQHLPHGFHAATTVFTLAAELALVWLMFLPRRFRIACFCIATPFQITIILTANYAFLNYLVLSLGFLLLDDHFLEWVLPPRMREFMETVLDRSSAAVPPEGWRIKWRKRLAPVRVILAGAFLGLIFYATTIEMVWMFFRNVPLLEKPVALLEPFRIANRYGLFAVMTHGRYEIEFQGSRDGKTWVAYPFLYKPQDVKKAPGIYAPYQPRFDWNLWFASLGAWREYPFVVWTEERLLRNDADVLALFAENPFGDSPPERIRVVIYQYWFTDLETKREQGTWWRRELLSEYAPGLERAPDGKIMIRDVPILPPSEP
jgi:lipase maturation factor 1